MSVDEQKSRALQILAYEFKKQLRSPAVGWEGMVFAASDKFDMVRKLRNTATAAFKKNPHEAIQMGLTDDEGVPIDPRPAWSTGRENPGYGKPLPEHSWKRTIFGIALKSSDEGGSPKFFTLNLNGDVAKNDNIPMYTPVKFRAIDKSAEGDSTLIMNASMYTKFELTDKQLPSPTKLIEQFCGDLTVAINNLPDYHEANKTDYNRIAIIRGDVSTLALEATSTGNRRIVVESEEFSEDLDAQGTTCWIPPHINLDFAENSKVIVFGSTSQGFKYENGQKTDELGDVMINAFGVYAVPEYKVSIETEEITEDQVVVEEEEVVAKEEKTEAPAAEKTQPSTSGW